MWLRFLLLVCIYGQLNAMPVDVELNTCELQLTKYRKFILQAILSFEDVCDAYNSHSTAGETGDGTLPDVAAMIHRYQPPVQSSRAEIWTFFKLLMAQFNDVEFTAIIRDAVIERCRIKSQLQRDEKRNSVLLGKKQRFHSWGGKRSQISGSNSAVGFDINSAASTGVGSGSGVLLVPEASVTAMEQRSFY